MTNATILNSRTSIATLEDHSQAPSLMTVIFLVIVSTLVLLAASYTMFDTHQLGTVARFFSVLVLGNISGMALLALITSVSGKTSVK